MSILVKDKPVYDERVNEILRGLAEGKTREELAEEFGHRSYKTLDIYMRRKNFIWDRAKQTYVPEAGSAGKEHMGPISSTKVAHVLALFEKEDADPRMIAKQLGFSDHREMANYMKGKGYEWDSNKRNYVRKVGIIEEPAYTEIAAYQEVAATAEGVMREAMSRDISRFLPLIEMLDKNKDRLYRLILPGGEAGMIPRYVVPGVLTTKSVHMPNTLDNLVKEYSREKNISQREIFQVALIDFFRKYGYEREVDALLRQR